jgi:hypothetical protein
MGLPMKTAGEIAFAIWYSGNYCPCAARSLPSRDRRRRVSMANLEPFSICEHPRSTALLWAVKHGADALRAIGLPSSVELVGCRNSPQRLTAPA